ncbi:3-hydroxyacyl-[acyl-carrier-protein] dehydratase [Paenibacillus tianmuensis]|uniref:3-hydroxyacyl-[acyl-carrier-protein] dehydratase n=1 Tax=Paenibacillus tianmuensis TaxID=624147 RepID=A0A1G4PCV6_9BACL|nr:3-hydroxyacyl-ACP dehydratase FabZ family protein [Paenibacillus tianmuensis]SCW30133.1 3-hydroxyacyl-[acyl-carrier-protein] dehydratase [Paenibacillus tianmuensis]
MKDDTIHIPDALPHRYPFLLIDRIVEAESSKWVRGYKNISWNEWFITEANPYMPHMLVVEALAQLSAFSATEEKGIAFLSSLNHVEMESLAQPGDRLDLYFEVSKQRRGYLLGKGLATVGDRVIVRAEEIVVFVQK